MKRGPDVPGPRNNNPKSNLNQITIGLYNGPKPIPFLEISDSNPVT